MVDFAAVLDTGATVRFFRGSGSSRSAMGQLDSSRAPMLRFGPQFPGRAARCRRPVASGRVRSPEDVRLCLNRPDCASFSAGARHRVPARSAPQAQLTVSDIAGSNGRMAIRILDRSTSCGTLAPIIARADSRRVAYCVRWPAASRRRPAGSCRIVHTTALLAHRPAPVPRGPRYVPRAAGSFAIEGSVFARFWDGVPVALDRARRVAALRGLGASGSDGRFRSRTLSSCRWKAWPAAHCAAKPPRLTARPSDRRSDRASGNVGVALLQTPLRNGSAGIAPARVSRSSPWRSR